MSLLNDKDILEKSSEYCSEILKLLVEECSRDLDSYVDQIRDNFTNIAIVDDSTLDNIILNIPLLIYYTNAKLERLGLKDDLSTIERKKKLRDFFDSLDSDIIKNKSERLQISELNTTDAEILSNIYTRAYKTVKSNIDTAYELLASCKKIMSRRIEQLKVLNSDTCRQQNPYT